MLKAPSATPAKLNSAIKVILLSLDRNCMFYFFVFSCYRKLILIDFLLLLVRLKSWSRQLPAAGERDLPPLLAIAT